MLNELQPLKRNQLSLAPIELKIEGETVHAQFFFRQSLAKEINMGITPLVLFGEDGKLVGRMDADLSELGSIPAESAMPWVVTFEEEHLVVPVEQVSKENWTIAFEQKLPHRLDLDENWEKSLATANKDQLRKIVEDLTPQRKTKSILWAYNKVCVKMGA